MHFDELVDKLVNEQEIEFTKRKKPFLDKPGRLNPTADLEQIAKFLNDNEIFSGAPAKGAGGWYAEDKGVHNDDAEGGYSGLSVTIVPEKRGLLIHSKQRSGFVVKVLFAWPVEAKHLNSFMQKEVSGE